MPSSVKLNLGTGKGIGPSQLAENLRVLVHSKPWEPHLVKILVKMEHCRSMASPLKLFGPRKSYWSIPTGWESELVDREKYRSMPTLFPLYTVLQWTDIVPLLSLGFQVLDKTDTFPFSSCFFLKFPSTGFLCERNKSSMAVSTALKQRRRIKKEENKKVWAGGAVIKLMKKQSIQEREPTTTNKTHLQSCCRESERNGIEHGRRVTALLAGQCQKRQMRPWKAVCKKKK